MTDSKDFLNKLKNQEQVYEQKKISKAKAEQDLENNTKLLEEQIAELKKLGIEESQGETELAKIEQEINNLLNQNEENLK